MLTNHNPPRTLQVLFADDCPHDAFLLRYGYRTAQIPCQLHHVRCSRSLQEWLANNPKPDAIILDLRMAAESGLDVLIALTDRPELAGVSKVVLSSHTPPSIEDEIARRGGHYFEKPFELEGWADIARATSHLNAGAVYDLGRFAVLQ